MYPHTDDNYDLLDQGLSSLTATNASDPWEQKIFTLNNITSRINNVAGKILTLIDASVTEPTQRKALKDRIKQDFYAYHSEFIQNEEYKVLMNEYNHSRVGVIPSGKN